MATLLNPRPSTSLDARDSNFEKTVYISVRKAINVIESPVKEKHVRRILLATYGTKTGNVFWKYAHNLPLEENPILCWKFCHTVHKLLRDGHPKAIGDSYRHRSRIQDLGKMWGLLRQGYGRLIQSYCTLLVNKLDFHFRNRRIPGNLVITDADFDKIGENDVNVFFQLCCEVFDYMDEILCLQNIVFNSLDMSRANSMTLSGQCRLAPLIMCIQDSSLLYDFTVKLLFKLHAALPQATLEGHRDRFYNQFKLLKQFYGNSRDLHYFKQLVNVPVLPTNPPNFFIQTELRNHVKPIVTMREEEPPLNHESALLDLSFNDTESERDDGESSVWSFPMETKPSIAEQSVIDEKDRVIEKLMSRIQELELDNHLIRSEDGKRIEDLKRNIAELECTSAQRMEKEIDAMKRDQEKQNLTEEQLMKSSEKFLKMKEFYNKLRSEHIELLRAKADIEQKMDVYKQQAEDLESTKNILEQQLRSKTIGEAELSAASMRNTTLQAEVEALRTSHANSKNAKAEHQNEIQLLQQQIHTLNILIEEKTIQITTLQKECNERSKNCYKELISYFVVESVNSTKRNLDQDFELGFATVNCTPQYFSSQTEILLTDLQEFEPLAKQQKYNFDLFKKALTFYSQFHYVMICSRTTIQNIPNIEAADEIHIKCLQLLSNNSVLASAIRDNFSNVSKSLQLVRCTLLDLQKLLQNVIPQFMSSKNMDLEAMLKTEIEHMDKAIQDAVEKIEKMIENSKSKDAGIKLEVNGKILDSCTSLMRAIKELITNAKLLQQEIASKERGSSSIKEFYQRNHRWTEGLISAAKMVAADANFLVDVADKVLSGNGKFEELMAASNEISASCAQLVVASRVKASSGSENLAKLTQSSKSVLKETSGVIATTKHCIKLIDESDTNDFSKLSHHQAKRMEMECQVRVLELESSLEKERLRLSAVRRQHYHLADSLSIDDSSSSPYR